MPLTRLDRNPISPARSAVSALMVVRNEAIRLPHVFEHHRKLGVDRFFVVDNGSTDGGRDWLLAQGVMPAARCGTLDGSGSPAAGGFAIIRSK